MRTSNPFGGKLQMSRSWSAACVLLLSAVAAATIFGSIHGLIHDPQHRPVASASVAIKDVDSDWSRSVSSADNGEFQVPAVPLGTYEVTVNVPGFAPARQRVTVNSGVAVSLHFQLTVAKLSQTVEVSAEPAHVNPDSSTSQTYIARRQLLETPGADRTNSLAMITDYVPGAVVVHDQLHIRGGHQFAWLLDGVPVPNTNIASNVGPQFDPKDIDSIEVMRGGLSAEYGDRTYGVFNVVTRSGFERNNQGEIVASYGSFNSTNDQINFGSHTDRFAYFASVTGNRTDLGLETPDPAVIHDLGSGVGGFASLILNKGPADQLRLLLSARSDHYHVPNTPEQQAAGIRDVDDENDRFANFSWVRTAGNGALLTVSPFYHFNRAHYIGGALDSPVQPNDDRGSNYFGGVASLAITRGKHNASVGFQSFGQREARSFSVRDTELGSTTAERDLAWGDVEAIFLQEQYKATSWLTLNGGVRLTRFAGKFTETAADPRLGAAVRVPRLHWILHGFYGRYYQPPPLLTVSGPGLELAGQQGFGFLPLHGERDEQHEFGLTIPVAGWAVEVTNFRTAAKNYFDHDSLGNSNIFFPLTLERARIRGWETSVRSPRLLGRAYVHLAYSHQFAEARGGVSGGLTDFEPPSAGYFFLDHDQRDTLSIGWQTDLPWRSSLAANVNYGSGFLDGDGPAHLPPHTTFDLALGKSFRESWSVRLSALNVTNHHYMIDNSNTFGGTHFANPRELSVQIYYRFKY
jgi:outer membrane receptor for ferrienterochelin and colicin